MKAYKLVRVRKDGSLGPLFINAKLRIPMGKWLKAEAHNKKGYAFRPGWHCCFKMVAPHLKKTANRVWVECCVKDHTTYARPESQGGAWILANEIKITKIVG
jgi:hypothetical protein